MVKQLSGNDFHSTLSRSTSSNDGDIGARFDLKLKATENTHARPRGVSEVEVVGADMTLDLFSVQLLAFIRLGQAWCRTAGQVGGCPLYR